MKIGNEAIFDFDFFEIIIIPNGISIHGEETCSEMLFVPLAHRRKNLIKRKRERKIMPKIIKSDLLVTLLLQFFGLSMDLKLVHV